MKTLLASVLALFATIACAEEPQWLRFYGYAYDLRDHRYLYTEVHEQRIEQDRWLGGSISYYAPDGTQLGRKTLDFTHDEYLPIYTLEQPQLGYLEGLSDNGDPIRIFLRKHAGGPRKTAAIARRPGLVADSGLHNFIRAHMAELVRGDTVAYTMVVPSELDSFKFRLRKIGEERFEDRDGIRLRMEPNSFLRFLAEPIELLYDPRDAKLLEFRGITNIRDLSTGRIYDARVDYYSKPPPEAPKQLPPLGGP